MQGGYFRDRTASVICDRRHSPRVPFELDAILIDGRRRYACRTRDFCSGGVLLEHDSLNSWSPHTRLRLEILPKPGDTSGLTFEIEVRHHRPPYLGAAFVNPALVQVEALYRSARVPFTLDDPMAKPRTPRLVERLAQSVTRMPSVYESVVIDSLRQVREQLAQAIGEGRSLAKGVDGQRLYGILMKHSREAARRARGCFEQELRQVAESIAVVPTEGDAHGSDQQEKSLGQEVATLNAKAPTRKRPGQPSLERLALIEPHEFEDWLVLNIATRSIEAELGQTLVRYKTALDVELGVNAPVETYPLAPDTLMRGLHGVLKPLQLSHGELTVLYRLMGPDLAQFLHDWYEALLDGVDYAASWHRPKPSQTRDTAAAAGPATENASAQARAARKSIGGDTLHTLRTLVELQSELQGAAPADGVHAKTSGTEYRSYSREELSRILDHLARPDLSGISVCRATTSKPGHPRPSLKQAILESLRGLSGDQLERTLPEPEGELIDFSERLLRAIIEDPLVSSAFKAGLEHTRYWVLRAILADDRFFSQERHPLRRLLNRLGQLSAGRLAPARFRVFLDGLLDQGSRLEGAPDLFERLLADVEERLARQEHQIQRYAERMAKAAEGRRLLSEARQRVHEDLRERLLGSTIPHLILELLYDLEWRQHLLISLLKQEESYREALAVLDALLSYPVDAGAVRDPRYWADSFRVLSRVRTELPRLSSDVRSARWLDAVTAWLRQGQPPVTLTLLPERFEALEACYLGDSPEELAGMERSATGLDVISPSAVLSERDRGRLSVLKVGNWLLLREQPGDERYLRLAWVERGQYGFVYLEGQNVRELVLTGARLVQLLESNQALRLGAQEQRPVDQAMIRVVQSVYQDMLSSVRLDPLTGLVNRHEFERQLEHHLARGRTDIEDARHLLCYLDIDRFRVINHGLGTAAGDSVLREVARLLTEQAGMDGLVGRLGSNEFGVLLPQRSKHEGLKFAEQLRVEIEGHEFHHQSHPIKVTLSLGIAEETVQQDSAGELLKRAGLACQAAKEQGGNRVRAYQAGSYDQARHQQMLDWVARLEQPLGQVVTLRAQAIVAIGTPNPESHYEILLGIRGPENSVLSPVPLIEAAEKFNRMQRIDRWVTESVFGWLRWRQNMHKDQPLPDFSINLSGNSLNDEGFCETLLDLLGSNVALTDKICFEITETAAIANLDQVAEFVQELKRYGCRLALDDFGTGLSSYAYLQQLPVDYVKIDGIFIRNLVESPRDRALVKSIAELARFMGIQTIAEYVENERILELLGELGVDYAQGYQVGKPVLLEQI